MELARDVYRSFEDIVGTDNISDDPVILDGYAFQPFGGALMKKRFFLRPAAVILPGSAKEVQSIIKLCNRNGVRYKAFCTGYGHHNAVSDENTMILDLRRMNRLIDIDEKNMVAVVEPYVSFIQVLSEAMKVGLCCNVLGAGCQASMLASYTSMHGNNVLAISQSYSGRNLLGVEWVLPTGEIIRLGAPGSGAGWFSGDGPGPSIRGILRGAMGACGSLGVFTKCAAHLHPWPGPAKLEVKGVSPYYETVIPQNFEYHICEFPSWQHYADAMRKVGEAGIAYGLQKTGGPGAVGDCVTGNNNEYYERKIKGELAIPRKSFCIIMASYNQAEHDWQVKTLDRILEETGGKIAAVGEDPSFKNIDFLNMIKSCFIPRLAFRPSGSFMVDGIVGMESTDHMALGLTVDEQHHDKWTKTGCIVDDGNINNWSITYEGSHWGLFECGHQFNVLDESSIDTYNKMTEEGMEHCMKGPFAFNWAGSGQGMFDILGPVTCNYPRWINEIKKTLDPNTACDPSNYPPGKDSNV